MSSSHDCFMTRNYYFQLANQRLDHCRVPLRSVVIVVLAICTDPTLKPTTSSLSVAIIGLPYRPTLLSLLAFVWVVRGYSSVDPLIMETLIVRTVRSPEQVILELLGVTCHVRSHSVIWHPTQVNSPCLTPTEQAGTRFTYPGGMEGWVDLVVRPGVELATFRSRVRRPTTAPPRREYRTIRSYLSDLL